MNKAELVAAMAENSGLTKADCEKALNGFTAAVQTALVNGDSISMIGFGSFSVSSRAARVGRNPRTGEEIQIAASKIPAFKAGKALKDAVNG